MHAVAELCPVADVRPVKARGHEQKALGLLHHRTVYDFHWKVAVKLGGGGFIPCTPCGDDLVQAGQMTRGVPGHLVDEYPCAPGEPGDVPVVAAGLVEPPRRLEVRLLDEPVDAAGASRPRPRGVEIAESSGRKPGLQADRYEVVGEVCSAQCRAQCSRHLWAPVHHVVGCHRQHYAGRVQSMEGERSEAIGVGRAARLRLDDEVLRVDLGQHCLDDRLLHALGHDVHLVDQSADAVVGVAKQRLSALTERQCVLRCRSPGAGPQPSPGSAGGDDGVVLLAQARSDSSSASSLARVVDSHGASMSVRPKWP